MSNSLYLGGAIITALSCPVGGIEVKSNRTQLDPPDSAKTSGKPSERRSRRTPTARYRCNEFEAFLFNAHASYCVFIASSRLALRAWDIAKFNGQLGLDGEQESTARRAFVTWAGRRSAPDAGFGSCVSESGDGVLPTVSLFARFRFDDAGWRQCVAGRYSWPGLLAPGEIAARRLPSRVPGLRAATAIVWRTETVASSHVSPLSDLGLPTIKTLPFCTSRTW